MEEKTKKELQQEIEEAKRRFKKPVTKLEELWKLSGGDYTDYTMRLGECGMYEHD